VYDLVGFVLVDWSGHTQKRRKRSFLERMLAQPHSFSWDGFLLVQKYSNDLEEFDPRKNVLPIS